MRGRPRSVSPEQLEEAATELFLEKGYSHTAIDDISRRAGVSRATFFNYFPGKVDVLFRPVDRLLDDIEEKVRSGTHPLRAIEEVAKRVHRSDLPLVATQADTMAAQEDVGAAGPLRADRLRRIIAMGISDPLTQAVLAAAIVQACVSWAREPRSDQTVLERIRDARARVAQGVSIELSADAEETAP